MAKHFAIGNDVIPAVLGREIERLRPRARSEAVEAAFRYWRHKGFPYVRLTRAEIRTQFLKLKESRLDIDSIRNGNSLGLSNVGCRLANYYHPQMWHAKTHGHLRSPFDYFQDDDHLTKLLERAPRLRRNERCWSPQAIRNLVSIYAGGRVANFRPVAARHIVHCFSGNESVVLDFSAGYGGRFLACLTLNRKYVGIDPAAKQIQGLKRMRDDLEPLSRTKSQILRACAEDLLPDYPTRSADLVFSSPPFYDTEIYSREPSQSSNRYSTYRDWRSRFLRVTIREARRILCRRGFLVLHVPSRDRHSLGVDAIAFASKVLDFYKTINIQMTARPVYRAGNGGSVRSEPIYVFKKR
jgi:SAM-dependent methyltransferase